jgi:[CysO sulfur-carrier protein]-S-L-cysteine hydrolase
VQSPVHIRRNICDEVLRHARENPLGECCGLLAGREGTITRAFEAVNASSDPTKSYEIAPADIFKVMREMRALGLELLAIYHSHPIGENRPSARDIEIAYYPETPYFIISPLQDAKNPIRAFLICDGKVTELEIQIL